MTGWPNPVRARDLEPGAVVRLVCGSPKMAVTAVNGLNVEVLWWSDRLGLLTGKFHVDLLVYPRPMSEPRLAAEELSA